MSSHFGLDKFNLLRHVSEVERGLACDCRCVVCNEPLVARQGDVREHHFAHASNLEPCASNHESMLHRYAKQLIEMAGFVTVPMSRDVAEHLGVDTAVPVMRLSRFASIEAEVSLGRVRPDLLVTTAEGVTFAIEVAYSSFCDLLKIGEFHAQGLPVLEIDLSRFTPEQFDADDVQYAVLNAIDKKSWLWPNCEPKIPEPVSVIPTPHDCAVEQPPKIRKPAEIILISGRMVEFRELEWGDLAIRTVSFDPDVVGIVKGVAKSFNGRYNPKFKNWIVPKWATELAKAALHKRASELEIVVRKKSPGDGPK